MPADIALNEDERELVKALYQYPDTVLAAGDNYSPALIANYIYDLSKQFNRFYQETPIMKETDESKRLLRLQIARLTAITIHNGMDLLGIEVPERM